MVLLVFSGFYGCTAVITPVVTEVAQKAYEDRTIEQQITDGKIHSRVLNFLVYKGGPELPIVVSTDVWQRRVLLTGTLADPRIRDYLSNRIRQDPRVRSVYNHIQIVPKEVQAKRMRAHESHHDPEGNKKLKRLASDVWIQTKIQAQFIAAGGVKSVNYRWQSVRGEVYIIGMARSALERDKVNQIVRGTRGVRGVKSYIEVAGEKNTAWSRRSGRGTETDIGTSSRGTRR